MPFFWSNNKKKSKQKNTMVVSNNYLIDSYKENLENILRHATAVHSTVVKKGLTERALVVKASKSSPEGTSDCFRSLVTALQCIEKTSHLFPDLEKNGKAILCGIIGSFLSVKVSSDDPSFSTSFKDFASPSTYRNLSQESREFDSPLSKKLLLLLDTLTLLTHIVLKNHSNHCLLTDLVQTLGSNAIDIKNATEVKLKLKSFLANKKLNIISFGINQKLNELIHQYPRSTGLQQLKKLWCHSSSRNIADLNELFLLLNNSLAIVNERRQRTPIRRSKLLHFFYTDFEAHFSDILSRCELNGEELFQVMQHCLKPRENNSANNEEAIQIFLKALTRLDEETIDQLTLFPEDQRKRILEELSLLKDQNRLNKTALLNFLDTFSKKNLNQGVSSLQGIFSGLPTTLNTLEPCKRTNKTREEKQKINELMGECDKALKIIKELKLKVAELKETELKEADKIVKECSEYLKDQELNETLIQYNSLRL